MTESANTILDQALELTASERSDVAEKLLSSLDTPDSRIDSVWAKEADARVEAFERGDIDSSSAEEVFKKYRNR
ncbi:MAG: addiction module protein [Anaerolineales bacterium]